jgi:periplasmic protein TonB
VSNIYHIKDARPLSSQKEEVRIDAQWVQDKTVELSVVQPTRPTLGRYRSAQIEFISASLREQAAIVGLVVLLHLTAFLLYWMQLVPPAILVNEMSISFATAQMQQEDVVIKQQPKPRAIEPDPVPTNEPEAKEAEAPSVDPDVTQQSEVVLDDEPDYRAEYLNNPRPPYPTTARQMGYQGIVLLNVEVLAEGRAGEVLIKTSSGYAILDKAALQTVKTWRFSPARRFGEAITMWFLVPVRFTLSGN